MSGRVLLIALLLFAAACFNWWRSYGNPFIAREHRRNTAVVVALGVTVFLTLVDVAVHSVGR